jgi:hypothetical protein
LPAKGETFRGLAATTLGWGQYLSFIEAWRRFADPGLVSRTANLTSQQMMAAVKLGNHAEKDFYATFRQTVTHLFPGIGCALRASGHCKTDRLHEKIHY